jgi:cell wall-associated NlpC family hydrolase
MIRKIWRAVPVALLLLATPPQIGAQQWRPESQAARIGVPAIPNALHLKALLADVMGAPYRLGGEGPGGFDCSGLARHVLMAFGIDLPRTSGEQARAGVALPLSRDSLQPGDLLFFGHGRKVSHVGVYSGDGRMVHASSGSRRVREVDLEAWVSTRSRRTPPWIAARRILRDEPRTLVLLGVPTGG